MAGLVKIYKDMQCTNEITGDTFKANDVVEVGKEKVETFWVKNVSPYTLAEVQFRSTDVDCSVRCSKSVLEAFDMAKLTVRTKPSANRDRPIVADITMRYTVLGD